MGREAHEEAAGARHSALAEFQRDERRPAVLLLAVLLIAAVFFALGIFVGRWTAADERAPAHAERTHEQTKVTPSASLQPAN
ncbi:MAG: hypothetical protein DMF64_06100 [Acidobacteria bacterium]|nr:MAG: hypothetical protein DMF64_06100 [Acidobacteriota bacterium]